MQANFQIGSIGANENKIKLFGNKNIMRHPQNIQWGDSRNFSSLLFYGVLGRVKVTKSITEADSYSSGTGMQRTKLWRKNAVRFGQLDKVVGRLSLLEKAMAKLLPKGE